MFLRKIKQSLKEIFYYGIDKVPSANKANFIFFNITNFSIIIVILTFIIGHPFQLTQFEWNLTFFFLFIFCFNFIALRLFGFLVSKRILATSMNLVVLFLLLKEKDLAIFLLFDIFAASATFFLFNIYERRDIFFFLGFNIVGLIIYFFVDVLYFVLLLF